MCCSIMTVLSYHRHLIFRRAEKRFTYTTVTITVYLKENGNKKIEKKNLIVENFRLGYGEN